ncbi:MAG: hypothetical protein WD845_09755 [Pirellulales bacterium]
MTIHKILAALAIYQIGSARLKYRGAWWFAYVLLLVSFVATYYAMSRLFVVWPYRLCRMCVSP